MSKFPISFIIIVITLNEIEIRYFSAFNKWLAIYFMTEKIFYKIFIISVIVFLVRWSVRLAYDTEIEEIFSSNLIVKVSLSFA